MSDFYRQRMVADMGQGPGGAMSFTDPALRVTAGVDLIVRRYLSIRPEVSAIIVRHGGDGETVATFGVRLGYRFEDHSITPGAEP
jgi:hypothetical protein